MADFSELVRRGREGRNLEYKRSQPWLDLRDKIAKTAMAMANLSEGGYIVVGMEELADPKRFVATGIKAAHRATFDGDEVRAYVNRFADPHLTLELHDVSIGASAFLVISVDEFEDVPVICRRDLQGVFEQGAIYCRPRRTIETARVKAADEIRAIIELAVTKRLRLRVNELRTLGLLPGQSGDDVFRREREGL